MSGSGRARGSSSWCTSRRIAADLDNGSERRELFLLSGNYCYCSIAHLSHTVVSYILPCITESINISFRCRASGFYFLHVSSYSYGCTRFADICGAKFRGTAWSGNEFEKKRNSTLSLDDVFRMHNGSSVKLLTGTWMSRRPWRFRELIALSHFFSLSGETFRQQPSGAREAGGRQVRRIARPGASAGDSGRGMKKLECGWNEGRTVNVGDTATREWRGP